MDNYQGTIIAESLIDKKVLGKVKIISTEVEKVTADHQTPWISQWTLHQVELPANQAEEIAKEISSSLDPNHSWYADFKNSTHHFIIFRDRVFLIDRQSKEQYAEARQYGISLGIPDYQVDFHPDTKEWKR